MLVVVGCGASHSAEDASAPGDAGRRLDAGAADAGPGRPDGRRLDASVRDAGPSDACADACAPGPDAGPECARTDAGCVPGSESFERVDVDMLGLGILETPHRFSSGLAVTAPVPNAYYTSAVMVIRCDRRSGFFGFGCETGAAFIPDGVAFMAAADIGRDFDYLELTLPEPTERVSFHVASSNDRTEVVVRAIGLDPDGRPVATATRNAAPVTGWNGNVIELSSADRIARVRIDCEPIGPLIFDLFSWQ